ncbi:tumor necrosis factor ligand superfamily member 13B-like [Conger conger]|uniref:tumor necrosis factor ligand superfamily member 13B-like n=1 Tax=Conger conger TaxID=82655 RepID=UPI002A59D1D3|nr:tumor necrosis factor ligand superfamily member 13B-like [Conger conger]
MSVELEEFTEEITEAPLPPGRDCDRPRRGRGRRPWVLLALTLTAIVAVCVCVLSFYRVRGLRSELSALRSEVLRNGEQERGSMDQRKAGKPEDGQHSCSGPESHTEAHSPISQQVLQSCLQMIGDSSRSITQRGMYIVLPWQAGLRQGTALQVQDNAILVTEGGIYFLYSQVYYKDKCYLMGHILRRKQRTVGDRPSGDILLKCYQSMDERHPFNTCYTGGIVRLEAGDQIELLIPRPSADVSLDGDGTFFGAVKLV